ncbi:MAG: GNAT family N-acetyltransferase [Desulfovibrionaceae bacterium]|nr:GNAT family N-acetyltransferase [Desulfovibrionaceae bacterium]
MLLLTGAPRSDRVKDFLSGRGDSVIECDRPLTLEACRDLGVDFMVAHGYGFILKEPVVSAYENRIVNLHNTFLPWGRGLMGNVWSFFEDTPKGVSLQFIDAGVGTGDIIVQERVDLGLDLTLKSSWDLLMDRLEALFMERWEGIVSGDFESIPQGSIRAEGSCHDRKISDRLLGVVGRDWDTPVRKIFDLGVEYRRDPEGFVNRHGFDPLGPGTQGQSPAATRRLPAGDRGEVLVRRAEEADLLVNWLWVNEPLTRRMFKQNDYIGWEGHCKWFARMLKSPDTLMYIGLVAGKRIGNVRFDRRMDNAYETSINLDPDFRGLGYGAEMLAKAIEGIRSTRRVDMIFAMAKKVNPASIKTFDKVGMPVVRPGEHHAGMSRFEPKTEVYMEARFL